jgi:flagellin
MAFSVNTNVSAQVALQSLTATNRGLEEVQQRINTGLTVSSAKDDSSKFVAAQSLRGDLQGLGAVRSSLTRAKSVVDVALSGAQQLSDILNQMTALAYEAADESVTPAARKALNSDYINLRRQYTDVVNSSVFDGINLLKSGGGDLAALVSVKDGDASTPASYQPDTLKLPNLALELPSSSGPVRRITSATDIITAVNAQYQIPLLVETKRLIGGPISALGAAARDIDKQLEFTSKLSDVLESGVGNIVDANLAKESAKLQALQVKQQLGLQALSIANQAPQAISQLFGR